MIVNYLNQGLSKVDEVCCMPYVKLVVVFSLYRPLFKRVYKKIA